MGHDEIHQTALRVMIEESSLPSGIRCFVCDIKTAVVWCLHCGPQHFFCEKCAMDLHTHALYHHCPELWKVSQVVILHYTELNIMFCKDDCYVPLDLPTPSIIEMTHNCASMSRRVVTCFHTDGRDQVGFLCTSTFFSITCIMF